MPRRVCGGYPDWVTSEAKESVLTSNVFQPRDSVVEKAHKLHRHVCNRLQSIPSRVPQVPGFPVDSYSDLLASVVTGRLLVITNPARIRNAAVEELVRPPDEPEWHSIAVLVALSGVVTAIALFWSRWAYALLPVLLLWHAHQAGARSRRRVVAAAMSDETTLCLLYCLRIISFTTHSGADYWSYSEEAAARFRLSPTGLSMPQPTPPPDEVESHLQMIYTNGVRMDSADWGTKEVIAATRRRWPDHPRLPELEKIAYQALMVGWRAATPLDLELAMTGRAQDLRHELQPLIAMARGLLAE